MKKSKSQSCTKSKSQNKPDYVWFKLSNSTNKSKKFMVVIEEGYHVPGTLCIDTRKKTIHFGAAGMSDYTIHKDYERMKRYENRHKSNENWTKSGIKTAGFWSKWILWNKPSFMGSVRDTERRFGIKIELNIKEV